MSKLNREQSIQLLKHCVKGDICDQCKERDTKKCILTMLNKIMNDEASTADVVEVVRCGECIHRNSGRMSCQGRHPDWYCPKGERREE